MGEEQEEEQAMIASPDGDTAPNDRAPEPNEMPTQEEKAMPEDTPVPSSKKAAASAAPTILPRGTWRETDERVRMSAPGHPQWVITADRTYYPVSVVEDPKAEHGVRGEILVHPGHVEELRATTEHRVLA